MKIRGLSVQTNGAGWMLRVWDSVRLVVARRLGIEVRPEGYGKKLNPVLELGRVNGQLVLMGRNQTMRMLLQTPHAESH